MSNFTCMSNDLGEGNTRDFVTFKRASLLSGDFVDNSFNISDL